MMVGARRTGNKNAGMKIVTTPATVSTNDRHSNNINRENQRPPQQQHQQ